MTRNVLVVGALYRGRDYLEGVLTTTITQDGWNATRQLAAMIGRRFFHQIDLVVLDGITLAGFNIVDIHTLHRMTGKPVLVTMRKKPDFASIRSALGNLSRPSARYKVIERAGIPLRVGPLYIQTAGLQEMEIASIIPEITLCGHIPEALRAAHLIAGGFGAGASKGRA
ncbi:MAG TPA: DUF99 family protein [Thermoanaerobaculia bacterium]|nr:DUF99 family protein [Thermoanaerobaculia bacterium]HUM29017.1 DUF99 family protein [Thermoanaerobaculia bacterium]HXK67427.1 DUF99 family protein [Thermoanaerobaculia bacterium]